jgi:thiol-disulfide isomerase/thioredoxin
MRTHILFAILSITIYLLIGFLKIEFFFPLYLIIVVGIDLLIKRKNTFALYFIVPFISIMLLIFDPDSIFRSFKYIISLPLVYFIKNLRPQFRIPLSLIFILSFHFLINPNWDQFYINQSIDEKKVFSIESLKIRGSDNEELVLEKDKTYLLDFWFTSCKGCYVGMNKFKEWSQEDSSRFDRIILVNVIMENETLEENLNLVKDYGFSSKYTVLSFEDLKDLGIYEYPTHLIIKDGKVVYKGRLTTNPNVFNNQIRNYLD